MKNAFVDSNGILTAWGFVDSNNDDARISVADDFAMTPGQAQYINGVWSDYAAPVDHVAANTVQQANLMSVANAATSGQADAFMLGLLDDADKTSFTAWAQYKLALSKVDLTVQSPAWPQVPA